MTEREAKEIFEKWMDCKDAYQADPSCDGNCFSCEYYASVEEEKEAMLLAISALEKQEQGRWHSVAKEGNPKESGFYLWTSKDGTVREDYYQVRDDTWSKAWQFGYEVIAWKKEPEPYTEEEA